MMMIIPSQCSISQRILLTRQTQDRQCTYNVTLRRVRATIFAVEKEYVYFYVTLVPSMCSVCAVLYSHLWTVRLYHTFPHYLTNGTTFGGKVIQCRILFFFLKNFGPKHFSLQKEFM
jgi:hypothetical protein